MDLTNYCCKTTFTMSDDWYAKHVVLEMGEWIESDTFAVDVKRTKTGNTSPRVPSTIGTNAVKKKAV